MDLPLVKDMKRGEKFVVNVAPEIDPRSVDALVRKLNVLLRASMIYSLKLDLNSGLKVILDLARELADFDRAVFYIYDEDEKTFYPGLIEGFEKGLPDACRQGNAFLDWTVENRLPVKIEESENRDLEAQLRSLSARSLVSVPILVGNNVHGVLQLISQRPYSFTEESIRFLWILALQMEGLFHDLSRTSFHAVAEQDPFTGLPVRSRFEQELDKEFLRSRRNNRAFSLMLIEIDNLQRLKEQVSFMGGGIIMREVAEQIIPMVRKIDTFAKYSETTLSLLLPETDIRQGVLMANRIRNRVASSTIPSVAGNAQAKVTVSIGTSSFPHCMTVVDLVTEASRNLHTAIQAGGNQVFSRLSVSGAEDRPVSLDLQALLDTLGSFFDMGALLSHLVEFFARLTMADRVSILVVDESGRNLVFRHGIGFQGFEEELQKAVLALEDSICGRVLASRQPLLVQDVERAIPQRARRGLRYSSPSFLSVPLIYQDEPIGVINFSNRRDRGVFTQRDLDIVTPHVQAVAKLLAEGRRFSGIQSGFLQETAEVLLHIAESKSPYLKGHSERVSQTSYQLARSLKLPEPEAIRIANAARYQNLGNIAVDEAVMGKSGPLDSNEAALVHQHPLWSTRLLQSFPSMDVDLPAVRTHHERFDGKGYPEGLLGEEIPIGGRIIAVADAYDAMIHERPFRPAMSAQDAIKVLQQKIWTQFDGRIVKAFQEIVH